MSSATRIRFRTILSALMVLGASVLVLALPAHASLFALTYETLGGDVITATIDGTLQADNNTVLVSSITDVTFNGTPTPPLPFVDAATEVGGFPAADPILTLDGGPVIDFIACTNASCLADGFALLVGVFGNPLFTAFESNGVFGDVAEAFNLEGFSLVAVPEPASLTLLGLGLGALVVLCRASRKSW